ncbi:glyoxalase [Mesonia ostreae]|uniref:Glyoxalase n=1 Tax=Mesonia ostreae TaxID=861110 RepID=A0ABU2KK24_9FLAO|nr:glyoxalase [Mesonia ostreae]MDT0295024.1 glyoxalase [Mesonia ostreae]
MMQRNKDLLEIRPVIEGIQLRENMSFDEKFQNKTLRPVIKLQHDLLIAVFKNYIQKHKIVFSQLSLDKRITYIENAIQKDTKFRNSVKGMIIGQFTTEEYEIYIQNSSALNKRMMNMVKKRLMDSLQLLEPSPIPN